MVGHDDNDPLFLQAKEAQTSVLEPFLGKSAYASHGQRVVEGQRLMQSASDIMLGWVRSHGDRRRRTGLLRPADVGRQGIGGHRGDEARDADRVRPPVWLDAGPRARTLRDPVAIASYLGSGDRFDRALATFAEAYADQNERDYAALQRAVDDGRVAMQSD